MKPHVISYLAGTAVQRPRKTWGTRDRIADLAATARHAPAVLALIAALLADSAVTKARHALHDWQDARRQRADTRRDRRAGEYPIVDRPLTFLERQARRRQDRAHS